MTSDFQKNVAIRSFKVEIPEEGEILIFIKTSEIIRTIVLNYEPCYVRLKIISRSLGKKWSKNGQILIFIKNDQFFCQF